MTIYRIADEVVFRSGRLKGQRGTVVDVRHEGHHVRVTLASGRTVSTRPGAIKFAPATEKVAA